MKTLVLSMPRMASKQVTFNLYRYFRAKGRVSEIYRVIDIEPSLDELFNIWHHRFKCKLIRDNNNLIRTEDPIISTSDEIENRCKLVSELTGPYVIKHFPKESDITDYLIKQVDRVYVLSREDIFSTALSICVSEISKSWIKSTYQQNAIAELLHTPVNVPVSRFGDVIRQILHYNEAYCADTAYKIEFNDICAATNSLEFCKLMDLEYIEFDFIEVGKEFGDNKTRMIINISELRDIFEEICGHGASGNT